MTLGLAERQGRLGNVAVARCEAELPERSIYRLLHAERDRLFPDELFSDLYIQHGRRSVPPSILAVVMVLQRLEGASDREAVDRFAYDLRWRYAAGVDDEMSSFAHTVLVELRARLRASADPDRVFRVTCELARAAGLVGVRRVLDSAPLYDAVATCDTVTLLPRGGRSEACCGPARPSWPTWCGRRYSGRTTTRPRASRSATGTMQPPASSWWTPCSATATGRLAPCVAASSAPRSPRRPRCWPR
jgi:transposase